MKLNTPVDFPQSRFGLSYDDRIMVLGSCFASCTGQKLAERGFDVLVNPFGTLYNPASVASCIERLESGEHFTPEDCVQLGAGSTKVGSFHHHTLAAKDSVEEFLQSANMALDRAREFWDSCNVIIVTLGTSWCYRHRERDIIVANCLKRNACEFERFFLGRERTVELLEAMVSKGRKVVFTVSPIRHLADGAHGNNLSKANLLLGIDEVVSGHPDVAEYFPAYEIMMDELRDYRFYAEDMIHPSAQAENYIFERFIAWALSPSEQEKYRLNDKAFRRSRHIPML